MSFSVPQRFSWSKLEEEKISLKCLNQMNRINYSLIAFLSPQEKKSDFYMFFIIILIISSDKPLKYITLRE